MKRYEALVITPSAAGQEGSSGSKSVFEAVLQKQGGKVLAHNDMGKRVLGYEVKKMKEGHAAAYDFELLPANVDPLRRSLQLSDGILKFMIVVKRQEREPRIRKRKKPRSIPASAKREGA